jgi:hypothetical protein
MDQDTSHRLNIRQQRFVDIFLTGVPAGRAYELAGYNVSRDAADTSAARLLRNAQVSRAIRAARRDLMEVHRMDRNSLISYLEAVLLTPTAHLDTTSPLVQEAKVEAYGDSQIIAIKMVSKIEAAKLLCKIMGWIGTEPQPEQLSTRVSEIIRLVRRQPPFVSA